MTSGDVATSFRYVNIQQFHSIYRNVLIQIASQISNILLYLPSNNIYNHFNIFAAQNSNEYIFKPSFFFIFILYFWFNISDKKNFSALVFSRQRGLIKGLSYTALRRRHDCYFASIPGQELFCCWVPILPLSGCYTMLYANIFVAKCAKFPVIYRLRNSVLNHYPVVLTMPF